VVAREHIRTRAVSIRCLDSPFAVGDRRRTG
jgi:hypothetical protein